MAMIRISESEDDDKNEEEEEEEEETESEESESKEFENEDKSLGSQRNTLQPKKKKHVGRLATLRKGNYLLKAQVDRLKDDLVKQRENSLTLQEDFDSVLAVLS